MTVFHLKHFVLDFKSRLPLVVDPDPHIVLQGLPRAFIFQIEESHRLESGDLSHLIEDKRIVNVEVENLLG